MFIKNYMSMKTYEILDEKTKKEAFARAMFLLEEAGELLCEAINLTGKYTHRLDDKDVPKDHAGLDLTMDVCSEAFWRLYTTIEIVLGDEDEDSKPKETKPQDTETAQPLML